MLSRLLFVVLIIKVQNDGRLKTSESLLSVIEQKKSQLDENLKILEKI